MELMELGTKIREIREEKHLSRLELAMMAKMTAMSIGRIENGEQAKWETLARVFAALGYRVSIVLEETCQPS